MKITNSIIINSNDTDSNYAGSVSFEDGPTSKAHIDKYAVIPLEDFIALLNGMTIENGLMLLKKAYEMLENRGSYCLVQEEVKNQCPQCEEGILVEFSSLNEKHCDSCDYTEEWKRKPGQPSKY